MSLLGWKIDGENEIFFSVVNIANDLFYCEGNNIYRINIFYLLLK